MLGVRKDAGGFQRRLNAKNTGVGQAGALRIRPQHEENPLQRTDGARSRIGASEIRAGDI